MIRASGRPTTPMPLPPTPCQYYSPCRRSYLVEMWITVSIRACSRALCTPCSAMFTAPDSSSRPRLRLANREPAIDGDHEVSSADRERPSATSLRSDRECDPGASLDGSRAGIGSDRLACGSAGASPCFRGGTNVWPVLTTERRLLGPRPGVNERAVRLTLSRQTMRRPPTLVFPSSTRTSGLDYPRVLRARACVQPITIERPAGPRV
jgi:hypothetical protein